MKARMFNKLNPNIDKLKKLLIKEAFPVRFKFDKKITIQDTDLVPNAVYRLYGADESSFYLLMAMPSDDGVQMKGDVLQVPITYLRNFDFYPDPLPMELCKFAFDSLPPQYAKEYPFSIHQTFVFHGELRQMPGHCVVSDMKTGQVYSGYHTYEFIPIPDEEG